MLVGHGLWMSNYKRIKEKNARLEINEVVLPCKWSVKWLLFFAVGILIFLKYLNMITLYNVNAKSVNTYSGFCDTINIQYSKNI